VLMLHASWLTNLACVQLSLSSRQHHTMEQESTMRVVSRLSEHAMVF
jgi:hypothetical protein